MKESNEVQKEIETIVINCGYLATIISGLYYGEDLGIEHIEELIQYLNENEEQSAFLQKYK